MLKTATPKDDTEVVEHIACQRLFNVQYRLVIRNASYTPEDIRRGIKAGFLKVTSPEEADDWGDRAIRRDNRIVAELRIVDFRLVKDTYKP